MTAKGSLSVEYGAIPGATDAHIYRQLTKCRQYLAKVHGNGGLCTDDALNAERATLAQTIAAAPDLLAAAQAVINHRRKEYLDCAVEPYRQLVTAIAKATGAQQ